MFFSKNRSLISLDTSESRHPCLDVFRIALLRAFEHRAVRDSQRVPCLTGPLLSCERPIAFPSLIVVARIHNDCFWQPTAAAALHLNLWSHQLTRLPRPQAPSPFRFHLPLRLVFDPFLISPIGPRVWVGRHRPCSSPVGFHALRRGLAAAGEKEGDLKQLALGIAVGTSLA